MFTTEEIIKATSAEFVGNVGKITGVSTDSRKIKAGELFVALRGEKFDGHNFADVAKKNKAGGILCDHKLNIELPQFIVHNTLTAFQQLANYHRRKMEIPVIGVTGTNGKTTVKEMISAILSKKGNPLCSEANFNNHIGVPMNLLKIRKDHTHAVIEMGMNHPGEIRILSKIAEPDVGVVTSVGRGHIEFLGSVEEVMRAKLEILEGLKKDGVMILPKESEFYKEMRSQTLKVGVEKIVSFGCTEKSDVAFIIKKSNDEGSEGVLKYGDKTAKIRIKFIGKHNCKNAAAAAAATLSINKKLSLKTIVSALGEMGFVGMRCEIININGAKYILDCYNANPDSTRAAIDFLGNIKIAGKKVALIGDMLELGICSAKYHKEIGEFAAEKKIDLLLSLGTYADYILSGAVDAGMSENKIKKFYSIENVKEFLKNEIKAGDVVLIKASRKARLEQAIISKN